MGSVAEWSKALVLGTSLFGGVVSNPTAAKIHKFYFLNISPMKTGIFTPTDQLMQKPICQSVWRNFSFVKMRAQRDDRKLGYHKNRALGKTKIILMKKNGTYFSSCARYFNETT